MGVPAEYETQLRYFAREVEKKRRQWDVRLRVLAFGSWLALLIVGVFLHLSWLLSLWLLLALPIGRFVPIVPVRARRRFLARAAIGASPHVCDALVLHWQGYLSTPLSPPPPLGNSADENILDTLEHMMRP